MDKLTPEQRQRLNSAISDIIGSAITGATLSLTQQDSLSYALRQFQKNMVAEAEALKRETENTKKLYGGKS